MQIYSTLIFICVSLMNRGYLCDAALSTSTPSTSPVTAMGTAAAPAITFNCSKDGKITDIVGDKSKFTFVDRGNYCVMSNPSCNWQNKRQIDVIFSSTEKDTKVIGGKNTFYYELECKGPSDFYAKANASFTIASVQPTEYLHKTVAGSVPTQTLTLTIEQNGKQATSAVEIGDELHLKMQGPAGYVVHPIDCKAYPNKFGNDSDYLLWTNGTCKSKDAAVMEDNWVFTKNVTAVKLFAFRFVETNYVLIICSAHLCPESDRTCDSTCTSTSSGRKRRDAGLSFDLKLNAKEETASAAFTVIDKSVTPNGCPGLPITSSILMAVGCAMIIFL